MPRRPGKRPKPGSSATVAAAPGQVRIIAGTLRGSKLQVPDKPGLRPTPDRVRETLFNWLAPTLSGAHVLDLFAGVGALGFEAASRGAASVLMIERDPGLARALSDNARRLHADAVRVERADALAWLGAGSGQRFDLVFIDPPFAQSLWQPAIAGLAAHLAGQARVYLESPAGLAPAVPENWQLVRVGQTRQTRFALYLTGCQSRRSANPASPLLDLSHDSHSDRNRNGPI